MGYYASSQDVDFLVEKENIAPLMDAFRIKFGHHEWAANCKDNVSDMFNCFGLTADKNQDGDIDDLFFEYGKYSSFDETFFDVIAPYVAKGSYITFVGEDNCVWAFYFDGETCEEYPGEITFPGMPMSGPRRSKKWETNIGIAPANH